MATQGLTIVACGGGDTRTLTCGGFAEGGTPRRSRACPFLVSLAISFCIAQTLLSDGIN